MTSPVRPAHQELKQRQSVMWGAGPYQRVAETGADVHDSRHRARQAPGAGHAVGRPGVRDRSGGRKKTGPRVIGVDLAPALIETARERAAGLDSTIDYRVGDCERLELPDAAAKRT